MADIWMDVDTALSEVPVNLLPLLDGTDFKTRETAIAFDAAGMDLRWNFVTTAGAYTSTAVTPTSGGTYDWAHQGDGMYSIGIPANSGASINNDSEGFGWFVGHATGVLPWRGPIIGFRAAAINNSMVDGTTIDVNVTRWEGTDASDTSADWESNIPVSWSGTLAAVTSNTVTLDSNGVASAGYYVGGQVVITGGTTGVGQFARITNYTAGRVATLDKTFAVTPTGTVTAVIVPDANDANSGNLDAFVSTRAAASNLSTLQSDLTTLAAAVEALADAVKVIKVKVGGTKLTRSGTTMTGYDDDLTTVHSTYELDDADNPTEIERTA